MPRSLARRFVRRFVRWFAFLFRGGAHDQAVRPASGLTQRVAMLDCESVMRQLWDYLDGELTPHRMAAVRAHLEMCKRCYPQHEFERSFLDAIAASARDHSNPARLRDTLMATLRAQGLTEA